MKLEVIDLSMQAMEKYWVEDDIASHIKKELDKRYSPMWHCVVGRSFSSFITHEAKYFLHFFLGQVAVLVWKSG